MDTAPCILGGGSTPPRTCRATYSGLASTPGTSPATHMGPCPPDSVNLPCNSQGGLAPPEPPLRFTKDPATHRGRQRCRSREPRGSSGPDFVFNDLERSFGGLRHHATNYDLSARATEPRGRCATVTPLGGHQQCKGGILPSHITALKVISLKPS